MADLLDAVDGHDWGEDADEVAALMKAIYPDLFAYAYDEVNASGQLPTSIDFDIEARWVDRVSGQLANKVKSVADTTKDDIRRLVERGIKEGLSPSDVARQLRDDAKNISKTRSNLIARTEMANGQNIATTYAYEDAGVSKVEVLDGDEDEACASVNGTTQTLDWARDNPIGHPNCTRAFAPLLD